MFKILFFLISFYVADEVNAQMLFADDVNKNNVSVAEEAINSKFGDLNKTKSLEAEIVSQGETEGVTLEELTRQNSSSSDDIVKALSEAVNGTEVSKKQSEDNKNEIEAEEDVFIPEGELEKLNKAPTFDGSVRGGQAFVEVDEEGRMKKTDKIFLFYDEFKITNYISKTATCDVRFNILSNLDRKITQLDIKLVWPDMTTTLSFSDVNPNTQTYYNYALIGNGCYNMAKVPNIIVNRCRVKGMSASECANKLVWLSK